MMHTKTKPGTYDENDYWIVSYTDVRPGKEAGYKKVEIEYNDVDNAYEDYCYYNRQSWVIDCTYKHYRR